MKKTLLITLLTLAMTLPALRGLGQVTNTTPTRPLDGFHVQLALTYANGMSDLKNKLEANNPGLQVKQVLPVGLSLNPYYLFKNGLAVGADIGPAIVGAGDVSFLIVPVGADVRYQLFNDKSISPYVRAGVEDSLVSGDLISGGTLGFFGAVGVDFGHHNKHLGWGAEVGYHTSEVTVNPNSKVKPLGFTASLFVRF